MRGQYRGQVASFGPTGSKGPIGQQVAENKAIPGFRGLALGRILLFATLFAYLSTQLACVHKAPNSASIGNLPDSGGEAWTANQPLRAATSGDYAPFSVWGDEEPIPTGFSIDLITRFALELGTDLEWVRFRWPDLLDDLAGDRFELAAAGITLRPDRSVAGRFSIPVTKSQAIVLVEAGSPFSTEEDLNDPGVGLAVNQGGHLERVARSNFPRADLIAIPKNQTVLAQLDDPRIRGVVTDSLEAPHWEAQRPGLRRIGPLTEDRKAIFFPTQEAALATRFDAWLSAFEASGELAKLRATWGLGADATAETSTALLAALDERLALMRGVAQAKQILGLEIEDRAREARVLEAAWRGVERDAQKAGQAQPEEQAIIALFQAQIEAAKWIQKNEIKSLTRALKTSSERTDEDSARQARAMLDETLRPALIRLGDQISSRLLAVLATGAAPPSLSVVASELGSHALPDAHLIAIHEALEALLSEPTIMKSDASPN